MAFDLTNLNISDTFQHLLQVRADDKTVYDALGNTLDEFRLSGSFTTSEFFEIEDGDSVTGNKLHSRGGTLYWGGTNLETGGGGVSNIVEDHTPQLGGELDLNSFSITGLTSTASLGRIEMAGHIVPNAGNSYDLGSTTKPFRDLHISSGSIKMYAGTEEIGRIMISDDDEFEFFNTKNLNTAQKLHFTPNQIRANAQRGKFKGKNIGDAATGSFAILSVGDLSVDDAWLSVNVPRQDVDFMLIKSGSHTALNVNNKGVVNLGGFTVEPTVVKGGFYYNIDNNEFYLGTG